MAPAPRHTARVGERVLYFPNIRVPESAWFTRMLLYWDTIGTIVPMEFINEPERLGEHTQSLMREGLVQPIIPSRHTYALPRFDEGFTDYLETLGEAELERRRAALAAGDTTRLHVEKVGTLERVLHDYRLGVPRGGGAYTPWYTVERSTAADFMAYLAACLGRIEELGAFPVTDREECWQPLLRKVQGPAAGGGPGAAANARGAAANPRGAPVPVEHGEELTELRVEVLEEILPGPRRPLTAGEIATFKRSHRDELFEFRLAVERELVRAAAIDRPDLRRRQLELFRQEVDEQVRAIERRIDEAGWGEVVFGKVFSLMAKVPGMHFGFGLANAVHNACGTDPRVDEANPLLYAAYAQVELGGQR